MKDIKLELYHELKCKVISNVIKTEHGTAIDILNALRVELELETSDLSKGSRIVSPNKDDQWEVVGSANGIFYQQGFKDIDLALTWVKELNLSITAIFKNH